MKYIFQSLWILYFYVLGLGVSLLIGGLIPGSILGMIFIFAALSLGWIKEKQVEDVSRLLIKYMILFFLPASIGIIAVWDMLAQNWIIILASAALSTVLVIAAVAYTQQKLGKRW